MELLLNGRSLGRSPAGEKEGFRTGFETRYEPGELTAIAFRDGAETGRGSIRTATGPVLLHARADRTVITAAGGDLAYVTLTLEDTHGTLCTGDDRPVTVTVSGDGTLAGFGSGNPSTEEPFSATTRRTYEGRALAVLRPAGPGTMRLLASSPGCDPAETVIAIE